MTTPQLILRRLRIVVYSVVALMAIYLVLRFDVVRLPSEGVSPLREFPPGARLLLDRYFTPLAVGDAVLFEGGPDELLLGRVAVPPPSAPEDYWQALAAGALWIRTDRLDIPVQDSLTLGPIEPERIRARVSFAFPW
jgi:hypothetical protein